jgi:hypothetical protein
MTSRKVTNTSNATRKVEEDRSRRLPVPLGTKDNKRASSGSTFVETPAVEDFHVDDAHFILGVTEGAGERE